MSKTSRSRKPRKPKGNQPGFDLEAELACVLGVNATTIDGINVITVQTVLAEVGPDLSAWKTEAHWSSWLNLAPKRDVSGGRVIRHIREHRTNAQEMRFEWPRRHCCTLIVISAQGVDIFGPSWEG
jgi:hypothetical protein